MQGGIALSRSGRGVKEKQSTPVPLIRFGLGCLMGVEKCTFTMDGSAQAHAALVLDHDAELVPDRKEVRGVLFGVGH